MSRHPRAWRFDRVAAPAFEPITVEQVRAHSRIDSDDPQLVALVPLMITAARRHAEQVTGRSFLKQAWLATGDSFPGGGFVQLGGLPYVHPLERHATEIVLANGPVVSVESVTYLDTAGVPQVLDPTAYVLDASGGLSARLAPAAGQQWPATQHQLAAVRVAYTAGRGAGANQAADAALVDENVVQWLLIRCATAFEHREEVEVMARGKIEPMPWCDGLLDVERDWAI